MEELVKEIRALRKEVASLRQDLRGSALSMGGLMVAAVSPDERVSISPLHETFEPTVGEGYTAAYYQRLADMAQARERPA